MLPGTIAHRRPARAARQGFPGAGLSQVGAVDAVGRSDSSLMSRRFNPAGPNNSIPHGAGIVATDPVDIGSARRRGQAKHCTVITRCVTPLSALATRSRVRPLPARWASPRAPGLRCETRPRGSGRRPESSHASSRQARRFFWMSCQLMIALSSTTAENLRRDARRPAILENDGPDCLDGSRSSAAASLSGRGQWQAAR